MTKDELRAQIRGMLAVCPTDKTLINMACKQGLNGDLTYDAVKSAKNFAMAKMRVSNSLYNHMKKTLLDAPPPPEVRHGALLNFKYTHGLSAEGLALKNQLDVLAAMPEFRPLMTLTTESPDNT